MRSCKMLQMHRCSDLQVLSRMHMSWTLECREHSVVCKGPMQKSSKVHIQKHFEVVLICFGGAFLRWNLLEPGAAEATRRIKRENKCNIGFSVRVWKSWKVASNAIVDSMHLSSMGNRHRMVWAKTTINNPLGPSDQHSIHEAMRTVFGSSSLSKLRLLLSASCSRSTHDASFGMFWFTTYSLFVPEQVLIDSSNFFQ